VQKKALLRRPSMAIIHAGQQAETRNSVSHSANNLEISSFFFSFPYVRSEERLVLRGNADTPIKLSAEKRQAAETMCSELALVRLYGSLVAKHIESTNCKFLTKKMPRGLFIHDTENQRFRFSWLGLFV